MVFDPDGITTERITEDADYQGIRVRIPVRLAEARGRVQVDVGFGDVVTPGPTEMLFPVLLEEMPSPTLLAYPMETVVAEKLEAMVSLSLVNSRMKDFFDLHWLALNRPFAGAVLQQAVDRTFRRRGTQFLPDPAVFQPSFAADEGRQRQWSAFLRQSHAVDARIPFPDVLVVLRDFLQPVHAACLEARSFSAEWSPALSKWVPRE